MNWHHHITIFIWWCRFIDWFKFETCPSSLRNSEMANNHFISPKQMQRNICRCNELIPEWKSFWYHVNSPWIPWLIYHVLPLLQVTLTSVFVWFYCNIQSLMSRKTPAWQFSCLIGMRLHVVQNSRKIVK